MIAQASLREPDRAAREMGLRYVSDESPGIRRQRRGRGFTYLGPDGRRVDDLNVLQRIHELVIPPAWRDVWICPSPNGHLQATGRDDAGRKQYRYHERWQEVRSLTKFQHLIEFAEGLPQLRRRVDADLRRRTLDRERVIAAVVRLLDLTLIRVGNEEYAQLNGSFGLTTLRRRHVAVRRQTIEFQFNGKSGQEHEILARDERVARVLRRCHELPGQHLFQYVDEQGEQRVLTSGDVNDYLREVTGQDITAKDFRTWGGTVLSAMILAHADPCLSESHGKRTINEAVKAVACKLGNRAATCRKFYIHPFILDCYREGRLCGLTSTDPEDHDVPRRGLSREERTVLKLLNGAAAAAA